MVGWAKKQRGDFRYPALTIVLCLCPGRHAGAEQLCCRYAGALTTPWLRVCTHLDVRQDERCQPVFGDRERVFSSQGSL